MESLFPDRNRLQGQPGSYVLASPRPIANRIGGQKMLPFLHESIAIPQDRPLNANIYWFPGERWTLLLPPSIPEINSPYISNLPPLGDGINEIRTPVQMLGKEGFLMNSKEKKRF